MFRCGNCGAIFETPEWEEWIEARPVGRERMAESHCPECGDIDIEPVELRQCYQCRAFEDGLCKKTDEKKDEDDECTEEEYESVPFPLWGF